MRMSGEVTFSKDLKVKKHIIDTNDLVRSVYKTPDNPTLEIFSIDHGSVKIADLFRQAATIREFLIRSFFCPGCSEACTPERW